MGVDSGQSLGSNTRQVTAVEPVMVTAILKLTEFPSFDELRKFDGQRLPCSNEGMASRQILSVVLSQLIKALRNPALTIIMDKMEPNFCIRQTRIPTSQTLGVSQCPSIFTLHTLLNIWPSIQLLVVNSHYPGSGIDILLICCQYYSNFGISRILGVHVLFTLSLAEIRSRGRFFLVRFGGLSQSDSD